jgi:hypothetical protein
LRHNPAEFNKIPASVNEAIRNGRSPARWTNAAEHYFGRLPEEGRKSEGIKHHGSGAVWFDTGPASVSSKSSTRAAASAMIARIPEPLARHIAAVYHPRTLDTAP